LYVDVRIDFGNPSSGDNSFVQSEVEHRRWYSIQVLQLKIIEVGEPKVTAQTLRRKRVRNDVADAQADDAHPETSEPGLFVGGDQVSVAVKPYSVKRARAENADNCSAPWVIHPPHRFGDKISVGCGSQTPNAGNLLTPGVDEIDSRISPEVVQDAAIMWIIGVQDQCAAVITIDDTGTHTGLTCGAATSYSSSSCWFNAMISTTVFEACFGSAELAYV